MSKKSPAISPEGRRAAQRVRTTFFLIAAANIVLAAVVMWHRHTASEAELARMETVCAQALTAYNAQDRDAFLALFSANAQPRADAEFFSRIIVGEYHRDFGRITASKPGTTTGGRHYSITCEKQPRAQLTVQFDSGGELTKITRWRMEPQGKTAPR